MEEEQEVLLVVLHHDDEKEGDNSHMDSDENQVAHDGHDHNYKYLLQVEGKKKDTHQNDKVIVTLLY